MFLQLDKIYNNKKLSLYDMSFIIKSIQFGYQFILSQFVVRICRVSYYCTNLSSWIISDFVAFF